MSSACVCHTEEWCFYCNMYIPLEDRYQIALAALERMDDRKLTGTDMATIANKAMSVIRVLEKQEVLSNHPDDTDRQHTSEP